MLSDTTHSVRPISASPSLIERERTRQFPAVTPHRKPTSAQIQEAQRVWMLQEQCRRLCLTLFAHRPPAIRSLGLLSSVAGEGTSFLAILLARVLAHDSDEQVTLLECNWDHPTAQETLGLPAPWGLAEWLRGECEVEAVRYRLSENLVVIPAGRGKQDAGLLTRRLYQRGVSNLFGPRSLLILDLPPVLSCGYGELAARLAEAVLLVVRAGQTPASLVAETCARLEQVPLRGIVLNRQVSRIPRWLQQLL